MVNRRSTLRLSLSIPILVSGILTLLASPCMIDAQSAHGITGRQGPPANQSIRLGLPKDSLLASETIAIVPTSPTTVSNCIPFGNNVDFGFTGFIYRNVPAFVLSPGDRIRFDLGAQNDQDIRRNIYFAVANKNPEPSTCDPGTVSQGIQALGWTRVVSDSQIPLSPRGNLVQGDFELTFTAEAQFSFPGGGFIVGFGASPPSPFADHTCNLVVVTTNCNDSSGKFYTRFFFKPDQTLGILDEDSDGEIGFDLGGIIIETANSPGANFDACIQDDSNGNLLQINSSTGDYQFTNCSGFTLSGTGSIIKKGSIITLEHNDPGRRVLARIDKSVNRGIVSVQTLSGGIRFSIMDRNTSDSPCTCF